MGHAASKLKRIGKAAEKSFGRKIEERLPAGEYVLLAKCAARSRHGAIRESWHVFGSDVMKSVVIHTLPQIQAAHSHALTRSSGRNLDPSMLVIPGNAESRANRARELLRQLWQLHVKGTTWEGKKQMYKIVADGGPEFSWWEKVAQVPFGATAVNDPSVSMRVCLRGIQELHEYHCRKNCV